MTRLADFAQLMRSQGSQKSCYQLHWEELQQFSIDSDVDLAAAMNLPYWVIGDFYKKGGWKIKKAHIDIRDQMHKNIHDALIAIMKKT